MLYDSEYNKVVEKFKKGLLTKDEAYRAIQIIEEIAYKVYPDAEPDGNITYGASLALDAIQEFIKGE